MKTFFIKIWKPFKVFKLRKCTILGRILAHFEVDGCHMSQKSWDRVIFTNSLGTEETSC